MGIVDNFHPDLQWYGPAVSAKGFSGSGGAKPGCAYR